MGMSKGKYFTEEKCLFLSQSEFTTGRGKKNVHYVLFTRRSCFALGFLLLFVDFMSVVRKKKTN
jgi:hypothetical protein